jgi:hypothetical protein
MSQHHVRSDYNNRPVLVVAGWDRPLQYAFMSVNYIERSDDEEEFIYNNLNDPEALTDIQDPTFFVELLSKLRIAVPFVLWEEIYMESALGGSNRVVHYKPDGTVISDSSQTTPGGTTC